MITATISSNELADATKGTKLYALRKERRVLQLISELVQQLPDGVVLSDDAYDTLILITRLQDEKVKAAKFYVEEGETIVSIMERYPNRRNLMKSITEYCENNGLRLDTATMVVVVDE
ncbi:MAG: hypothetical protein IKL53_10155 [Lachnospiraceae bacterium]|nr:hypothetical protein [Lachnospiraceae bacterium]